MRVFFAKVVPEPNDPETFSSGWAEAYSKDGRKMVLHNCQTCVAVSENGELKKRVIELGDIRVNRAILTRVAAPEWFRRTTNLDKVSPLKDRTR